MYFLTMFICWNMQSHCTYLCNYCDFVLIKVLPNLPSVLYSIFYYFYLSTFFYAPNWAVLPISYSWCTKHYNTSVFSCNKALYRTVNIKQQNNIPQHISQNMDSHAVLTTIPPYPLFEADIDERKDSKSPLILYSIQFEKVKLQK